MDGRGRPLRNGRGLRFGDRDLAAVQLGKRSGSFIWTRRSRGLRFDAGGPLRLALLEEFLSAKEGGVNAAILRFDILALARAGSFDRIGHIGFLVNGLGHSGFDDLDRVRRADLLEVFRAEMALGIIAAPEEPTSPASPPAHDIPAAFGLRAFDAGGFRLHVAALRISAARDELPEAPMALHKRLAARGTVFVEHDRFLDEEAAVVFDLDPLDIPAFRIRGTGEEMPLERMAYHHRVSALVADIVVFLLINFLFYF